MGGKCARERGLTFCHSPLPSLADTAHPVDALNHLFISLTFCKFAAEGDWHSAAHHCNLALHCRGGDEVQWWLQQQVLPRGFNRV